MKAINLKDVDEMGNNNSKRLQAGAYIAKIIKATDLPDKEYLVINFDICEGEYKDYFLNSMQQFNMSEWPFGGTYRRSYKEKAKGFFKHFLSCIDKSNGTKYLDQAEFGLNEVTLAGKKLGIVLAEEEYISNNGETKTRLFVAQDLPVEDVTNGNFKIPEIKKLQEKKSATGNEEFMQVTGSTLPQEW